MVLACGILVEKRRRRRPRRRSRSRRVSNSKIVLFIGWEVVNWLREAQEKYRGGAVVITVMNLWVSYHVGDFMTS